MQNKVLMRRFPDAGKRRRDYEAPATRSSSVQSSSDPWDIAQLQQNYLGQLQDTPIDYFENCSAQDYAVHNLLAQDFAAQSCTAQDCETQNHQVQLAQAQDNEAQKHLVQDCATQDCETQDCETQDCETKHAQTQDHKPETKAGPVLTRYLACPFYMSNRHKYHDCLKYELRRVKDVRQHIYRKHTRPDFYCARCFQKFSAAEFRDRHTRELRCQRADDPQFDGISNRQLQLLKSYVSRGRTVEEQWHDTWGIIFPDQPQPKSCYPANHVEETMSQIRALWNQKQSEIIPSVLDDNRGIDVSPVFIDKLMKTIFDRLESQLSGPTVANEATLPATVPRAPLQIVPAAVTDHNVSCQSVGMADFEQSWHLIGSQFANTAEQSSFPTEERLEDGWVADFSYTTGGYYSLFYDSLTELGY
ncbi:hypothetical protein AK830_g3524 [Neonectria ditissima]|uniref:C2H2-type domain-containing protein n=1 Tax=Neonectria ditissima TaxID=78410 RepID=A0A0P7BBP3_9HYPO|nr:hypothetical protein AK830_g3524 [Neonectria ditissima]